ncbi:hypothetical protein [Massilia sp. 9096]|uniref:hypothetical protein n=1 Tax=Massilia sp. 9096 TaxID=1500894 RepID=UPI00056CDC06|nr:hypothetical protein [Massilia sp. 9096]
MQKIVFLLLTALSCAALTACAAHPDPAGAAPTAAAAPAAQTRPAVAGQVGDTLARIHALVGVPSCSADAQCKTLALGARPCGGPEGYLAYSTARTPEAELHALGGAYEGERRAANSRAGMVSTCLFRPDPGAVCRAGVCALDAGPGAPVAR